MTGRGGDVLAVRRGRSARRPVLRELRRRVVGGLAASPSRDPCRSTGEPCADCGNDAYFDEYCTVVRPPPRRTRSRRGGSRRDRADHRPRSRTRAQRGRRRGRDRGRHDTERPDAIAVACATGSPPPLTHDRPRSPPRRPVSDAMLAALAASRNGTRGGRGGSRRCGEGRGRGRDADSPLRRRRAPIPRRSSSRPPQGTVQITVGNVGDSRAYWLPEPPALARQLTVDDSVAQELITAGAAADSEAVQRRRAHADPLARRRRRSRAVVGLQRADDHRRRARARCCCAPTDCGTTCPTPTTSHDSAAVPTRQRRRAHSSNTRCDAGGHDNITVAVIPIGGRHEFG